MSSLVAYLEPVRQFVQRSPILFWCTAGLVAVVGVLFVALPSSQVRDAIEPIQEKSDVRGLGDKTVVPTDIGEAAPAQPAPDRVATEKRSAEKRRHRPTQKPTARGTPESPSADSRVTAGGRFTVQVGSFVSEEAAKQTASKLKAAGYPAFVKAAQVPGKGRTYRVRVGMFESREEARRYGDRLVKQQKTVKSVLATIDD